VGSEYISSGLLELGFVSTTPLRISDVMSC
jgi:hypothetical protein